jgi:hypothetical protein
MLEYFLRYSIELTASEVEEVYGSFLRIIEPLAKAVNMGPI